MGGILTPLYFFFEVRWYFAYLQDLYSHSLNFNKLKKDRGVSEKYLEATMFSQQEVLGLRTFLYAISALCLPEMSLLVEEATPGAEGI